MRSKTGLPALASAVVIDGEVTAAAAVGTRKMGTENWMSVDDMFIIRSCGKAFTAVLGAMMAESGYLEWDTTLKDIFPDIFMNAVQSAPHYDFEAIRVKWMKQKRR